MSLRNSELRYGAVAMAFHWLIAALIIVNVALAVWFERIMDHHDAIRFDVIQTHKSIGLTVLVLSVARLAWKLINPTPRLPADMSREMKFLAHASHYTLYFLMISVPLLGWMLVSASRTGIPTLYFGLFEWPNFHFISDLPRAEKILEGRIYASRHVTLAYGMLALVIGHIGAALYHHFLRRDQVLKQMLPGSDVRAP